MIIRLMVILNDTESDNVGLALLNSMDELPKEKVKEIRELGGFDSLDKTATSEEAILYTMLEHKLPHIVDDTGKLLDGGRYVDPDGLVAENARVAAHFLTNAIQHPKKGRVEWSEIEELIYSHIAGCTFLPEEDNEEEKVIEFKGGKL